MREFHTETSLLDLSHSDCWSCCYLKLNWSWFQLTRTVDCWNAGNSSFSLKGSTHVHNVCDLTDQNQSQTMRKEVLKWTYTYSYLTYNTVASYSFICGCISLTHPYTRARAHTHTERSTCRPKLCADLHSHLLCSGGSEQRRPRGSQCRHKLRSPPAPQPRASPPCVWSSSRAWVSGGSWKSADCVRCAAAGWAWWTVSGEDVVFFFFCVSGALFQAPRCLSAILCVKLSTAACWRP